MGFFSPDVQSAPPPTAAPPPPPAPTAASYNASFGDRRRQANPTIMTSSRGDLTTPRRARVNLLGE
jgi:hypothetical protein